MKVSNAVVGTQVQVKRDCRGHSDEIIKKGLVCDVGQIDHANDSYELSLEHPDIEDGYAWVNASDVRRYIEPTESPEPVVKLTEVDPKPKELTLADIQVGDWLVCSDDRYGLTVGVAYEVLRVHSDDGLFVSNPVHKNWVTGYATRVGYFNKVLREVNDATPRVVKSSSESPCRSE